MAQKEFCFIKTGFLHPVLAHSLEKIRMNQIRMSEVISNPLHMSWIFRLFF